MANDVTYVRHRIPEYIAFESPTGMVGQWTAERAAQVAAHAAALAPKPGQGRGYATGELASSMVVEGPTRGRRGPEATVTADTDYSLFVHEGTRPHKIRAQAEPKLVFFWRKRGQVIGDTEVDHPGTPANPFLVKALRAVLGF